MLVNFEIKNKAFEKKFSFVNLRCGFEKNLYVLPPWSESDKMEILLKIHNTKFPPEKAAAARNITYKKNEETLASTPSK